MTQDLRLVARRPADEVLFPSAMRVYGLDAVPAAYLGALAAEGLYGLCVPESSSISCDQPVFVDQAVDASLFPDAVLGEVDRFG